ncbi:AAA family ATPase [Methanolobus sp. ZRKC2]|uniref:AAA family ATPase n=1 Tax=Methanolobus sp. ZRKC2 TaxID=3125783 RepID=UPI0032507978
MFLKRVSLKNVDSEKYGEYPFCIPSIRTLHNVDFKSNVTFFIGENGTGKSTLLEAIAYQAGFNTAGGSRDNCFTLEKSGSSLGDFIRLSWMPKITSGFFLRAETFYDFASHIDDLGPESIIHYGGKSLHEQSHGEAFLSLLNNRFGKDGIYLLDEPEAALSPLRQMALLKIIHDLESNGKAQFIIATHSPLLMAYPEAQILNFNGSCIENIEYEDTDHYKLTRDFLNYRERYLQELFRN